MLQWPIFNFGQVLLSHIIFKSDGALLWKDNFGSVFLRAKMIWNFFYFLLKLWLIFGAQALPHYFICPRVLGPLVSCRPCPPGDPIAWHWASLQFHDPSRIKETQLINKSLMSLKDCIRNRALSALNIGELVNFPFLDFIRRIHCRGRYSSLCGILIDVGHLWLWPLL